MSIGIDEFKLLENEIVNNVLYFALKDSYSKELSNARSIYAKILDENNYVHDEKNFTSWLLWDYRLGNGNNFFKEYLRVLRSKLKDEEHEIIEEISNAYLSIYEIRLLDNKKKLIDIFSKKEIIIKEGLETIDSNQLLIGRLVEADGESYVLEEYNTLNKAFQNGIEKVFFEKFETYKNRNGSYSVEEFTKANSPLINSFTSIAEDIRKKMMDNNDEYNVYQSNYAVLDYGKLCEALSKSSKIEFDYEDNSTLYYIMYPEKENRVLSEIVLSKSKLELECVSNKDSEEAKEILEAIAGDFIKYINDEIITLDDVL